MTRNPTRWIPLALLVAIAAGAMGAPPDHNTLPNAVAASEVSPAASFGGLLTTPKMLATAVWPTGQDGAADLTDSDSSDAIDDAHQGKVLWSDGNWTVLGDEEDCSLDLSLTEEGGEESFSNFGVTLPFGGTSARVAFANSKFTQIAADETYPVSMVFIKGGTSDRRWGEQSFRGFEDFQANALFADLSWDELHRDLIEATALEIFLNGELLDKYPLGGAGAAVSQFEQCLVGASGVSDPRSAPLTV